WAAVGAGVAGRVIDVDEYRAELDARLGRAREVMRGFSNRAQQAAQRIVFPEGDEPRILKAARILADDGVAEPLMLRAGQADAVVAGVEMYYPHAIRPALEVIGAEPGRRHVSGIYMLVQPQQTFF